MVNIDDWDNFRPKYIPCPVRYKDKYKDVFVHDLKTLQKQREVLSKRKAEKNLKNGWSDRLPIFTVKDFFKPVKKVVRNNLPEKIRIDEPQ